MVLAEEFGSVREYVENACRENRMRPREALRTGNWAPESAGAMRTLVRSMPSADVWSTLRFLKHRDLNLPWEQHDWTDMWALSVAIPYCDVVVTEAVGASSHRRRTREQIPDVRRPRPAGH